MFGAIYRVRGLAAIISVLVITACSAQYRNHGYVPAEEDLNGLIVGVDSRSTVDDVVGAPSTSSLQSGGDYYYVRSRVRHYGPLRPQVVERNVVAISFDERDTIANIEHFSLEDGRIVPLTRRVTDSSVVGNGFLRQLLRNIGNIDPTQIFN